MLTGPDTHEDLNSAPKQATTVVEMGKYVNGNAPATQLDISSRSEPLQGLPGLELASAERSRLGYYGYGCTRVALVNRFGAAFI